MANYSNASSFLEATQGAAGLAAQKTGFCWTAEDDALFALGWPHLRLVAPGHADDKKPEKNLIRSIDKSLEGHYFVCWPQQVALRYVRAFGSRGKGAWTTRNKSLAKAAAAEAKPVTEKQARKMLAVRVRGGGPVGSWYVEHFVLLLEAQVGAEVVLDALVEALECKVGAKSEVEHLQFTLGFLLLRVAPELAKKQRARLQAVLDGTNSSDKKYDGLRCSLGGAKAARSMGMNPSFYHHAADDPQVVRDAVKAGKWLPSARHVFIGGESVIETIAPFWKRQKGAELQRKLAAHLAPVRSTFAVRVLADMAGKSSAKKQIPQICSPYLEYMREELESLAKDSAVSVGAKALLEFADTK